MVLKDSLLWRLIGESHIGFGSVKASRGALGNWR